MLIGIIIVKFLIKFKTKPSLKGMLVHQQRVLCEFLVVCRMQPIRILTYEYISSIFEREYFDLQYSSHTTSIISS